MLGLGFCLRGFFNLSGGILSGGDFVRGIMSGGDAVLDSIYHMNRFIIFVCSKFNIKLISK